MQYGPLGIIADGNYVSDDNAMYNILNDYFGSVFTEEIDLEQLPEDVIK
jgi:hypothetical protein